MNECKICQRKNTFVNLYTYKYLIKCCRNCESINTYLKKKKINLNSLQTKKLKNIKLGFVKFIIDHFTINKQDNKNYYFYYNKILNNFVKWKKNNYIAGVNEFRQVDTLKFIKKLKNKKINLINKKVLFVSGEPGFVAKYFSKNNKIYITAFNKKVANLMAKILKVETKSFDMNKDNLLEIYKNKFDIIISLGNSNYSENLSQYIDNLTNCLKPNGLLLFDHINPNISYILFWQFFDYMPKTFVKKEKLIELIKKKNLKIKYVEESNKENIFLYYSNNFIFSNFKSRLNYFFKLLIFLPFNIFYYILNIFKTNLPFKNNITEYVIKN